MKKLLLFVLAVALATVAGAQVVVDGDDPWCVVTAEGGTVEVRIVALYNFDDPQAPDQWYTYHGPPKVLHNEDASVLADWLPVAFQVYGNAGGNMPGPRRGGPKRFRLIGGCGKVPPPKAHKPPKGGSGLLVCEVPLDEPMDYYAIAYYLHTDPENPTRRYQFRSETVTADEATTVEMKLGIPYAVQWYYRQSGTLAHYPAGEWVLAKQCGQPPVGF